MTGDVQRSLAAEGLGTLVLLATVVGSGIMAERLSNGNLAIALLGNTLPTGAILVVLIATLGPFSGAHFNPIVTLAFLLRGEIKLRISALYVIVQVCGAILGVWMAHMMFDENILQLSSKSRSGFSQWFSEVIASIGLVVTIVLTVKFRARAVAMNVGLYISAAYWFTASTSFANPAVTIARSLSNTFSGIRPADVLPFVAAQLCGGLLATVICHWFTSKSEVPSA